MNYIVKRIFLFFFLVILFTVMYDEIGEGKVGIGLNYPGLGVRYFLSNKISVELKGQYEKDIAVVGLRGYHYFNPQSKHLLFVGFESDHISFKGEVSEGTGFATELFVGGEYFFGKRTSFQLDLGPAFIILKDKDTSESVNGLEYVINFGINYYFGDKAK